MAKIKSNLVDNMEYCYECGRPGAECHHVFFGSYQKAFCTRRKLYLPLCYMHHREGKDSPHRNRDKDLEYRMMAQQYYEENMGTREEFIQEFGRNYL